MGPDRDERMMGRPRVWVMVGCIVLALGFYHQPWYTHETAGFTMHAYDLAEFASLHPAVRSSSPPMQTSFLLRAPLLMLVTALAVLANEWRDPRLRWVVRGAALGLALRFVPPSDFITGASADPNYRQMALLTALGFVALPLSLLVPRVPAHWQRWLVTVVMAVGVAAGWIGLSRADTLMANFEIDVSVGYGMIGFTVVSAVAVLAGLWPESGVTGLRRAAQRSPV